MSNDSALTELGQEIVAQFSSSLTVYYVQISAAVIVFYDYLQTIQLETSLIWNGKVNLMKVLFCMNRYAGFMFQISFVFLCNAFNYMSRVSEDLSYIAIYSIFTLRTFAICERSWIVFFVLAIPALVEVAANIWEAVAQTAYAFPRQLQVGPNTLRDLSAIGALSHYSIGSLTSYITTTIFDALVIILTVRRTYRLAKSSREVNIRQSLSYILLRDGIIYYSVIFLPIFATFVMNAIVLKDGSVDLSYVADNVNVMFSAVRNVAVNRLILSLSKAANSRDDSEYRSRTGLEPPIFVANSALGNIGGHVHSGLDDHDEEEEPSSSGEEEKVIDNGTNNELQENC